jgi:hypothetical protein
MSELARLFLFNHAVSLAWGQKAYFTTDLATNLATDLATATAKSTATTSEQ